MKRARLFLVLGVAVPFALSLLSAGCRKEPFTDCPTDVDLLEQYTVEGQEVAIYADGKAYLVKKGECSFAVQYFEPDFFTTHYRIDSDGVAIRTDEGDFIPTRSRYEDDFEGYADFLDLFLTSVEDTNRFWITFTAQSPDNPEIADYNALRQCIMAGTCAFTDNKMELIAEPGNTGNHVIRFTAVKPKRNMVTSKMSFDSQLPYFVKGMDLWFQADYKIEGEYPYSLVDFENPFFEGSPGPRLVIDNGALAMENKFGEKLKFRQTNPIPLPQNAWVTVKVHLLLNNTEGGRIEVWQDGIQVLAVSARNLPTYHSVQSSLEVGISASSEATSVLLDNVRISDVPF
jgi:hypothetical protein